jgi:Alpha/beta hydrolase family
VQTLISNPPPGAPVPPIVPPQNGFLFLDRAKFAEAFAADVAPEEAAFMADSQVPWGVNALVGAVTEPAWKSKPSWYLVSTEDKMIPPPAQRQMAKRAGATVVETKGSHAVYVSQPQAVIKLIEQAAQATARAGATGQAESLVGAPFWQSPGVAQGVGQPSSQRDAARPVADLRLSSISLFSSDRPNLSPS